MIRLLFIVVLLVVSYNKALHAESTEKPQAKRLSSYCSPIESDTLDYGRKLSHARQIINTKPESFFRCQTDEDCLMIKGACAETISIARIGKTCFERAATLYGATVDCISMENKNALIKAVCLNQTCQLQHIASPEDVTEEQLGALEEQQQ